jgi:hypothetical protein
VWPVGRPSGWIGYRVAAGLFELKMVAQAHKDAVLHVIGESPQFCCANRKLSRVQQGK